MAADCTLELRSEKGGARMVQMDGGFYTGYRRNILAPDEILVSISVPYTEEDEHFVAFKQAKRRDDDIAIVNSAFFFKLSGSGEIEVNARLRLSVPSLEPPTSSRPDGVLDHVRAYGTRLFATYTAPWLITTLTFITPAVSGITFTTYYCITTLRWHMPREGGLRWPK